MTKADRLREYLSAAIPALKDNPDRFQVFVDKGSLRATGAPGAGGVIAFEKSYTCTLLLLDFAGDENAVFLAVIAWLSVHQVETLQNFDRNRQGVGFECDVLDAHKVDLQITLDLTERIGATPRPAPNQGGYDIAVWAEPAQAGQDAWMDGPAVPPLVGSIYAGGELIAELPPHDG